MAPSARYSWTNPTIPLSRTTARMASVSRRSPSSAMTPAATSSTTTIVLVNCATNTSHAGR